MDVFAEAFTVLHSSAGSDFYMMLLRRAGCTTCQRSSLGTHSRTTVKECSDLLVEILWLLDVGIFLFVHHGCGQGNRKQGPETHATWKVADNKQLSCRVQRERTL